MHVRASPAQTKHPARTTDTSGAPGRVQPPALVLVNARSFWKSRLSTLLRSTLDDAFTLSLESSPGPFFRATTGCGYGDAVALCLLARQADNVPEPTDARSQLLPCLPRGDEGKTATEGRCTRILLLGLLRYLLRTVGPSFATASRAITHYRHRFVPPTVGVKTGRLT